MSKSDSNPREYKQVLSLDLKDWMEGADLTLQYFTCQYFFNQNYCDCVHGTCELVAFEM